MNPSKHIILALAIIAGPISAEEKTPTFETDYFGAIETAPDVDPETNSPKITIPDPYASDLFIDGKTNVALDGKSMAAEALKKSQEETERRKMQEKARDKSVRLDLITGQRETIFIAPDHFVQLILLMDGEVVKPTNVTAGNPEMVEIKVNVEKSPYIYVSAPSAVVDEQGRLVEQPTNLFIETSQNGKVQTYPLRLVITEPKNITEQIILNLTGDNTPPIKGGEGSREARQKEQDLQQLQMAGSARPGDLSAGKSWEPKGDSIKAGEPGTGHESRPFSRDDVRAYLPTMVQMAQAYDDAKFIEKNEGRTVYTDYDIQKGPAGQGSYRDPVSGDVWTVRPWFFPRYDAVLLEVVQYNPGTSPSGWNFSLLKFRVGKEPGAAGPRLYDITGVSPESPTALPKKGNKVWALLQGYNLTATNEFIPVFPDKAGRVNNR
jgi:hypothetical protein